MRKIISHYLVLFYFLLLHYHLLSGKICRVLHDRTRPTGVYFQTGNAICKMLHKYATSSEHGRSKVATDKAYRCTAPSTGGSNYNIGQIKEGEFQFGSSIRLAISCL